MSEKGIRLVNVVPLQPSKIKQQIHSDEDEDCLRCRICKKSFASAVALRNHAMMEHFEVYSTGNPENWTCPPDTETSAQKKLNDRLNRISSTKDQKSDSTSGTEEEQEIQKPMRKKRLRLPSVIKPVVADLKEIPKGPFECIVNGSCHKVFTSCCEYSIHYRDEHTRRRKGLRCQVCEKPLSAGDCPFPCNVCGAGFDSDKELSEHTISAHVKLRPYQCPICPKRFTQQTWVRQHIRLHTGDRPFKCSVCTKGFAQKSGLDQHMRIHNKVKPYRCVVCGKTFCQSMHLKLHMGTHTKLSPFKCPLCGQKFKQSSHLTYHLKNHDINKPDGETEQEMLMVEQDILVEENVDNYIGEIQDVEDHDDEESIPLIEECVVTTDIDAQ